MNRSLKAFAIGLSCLVGSGVVLAQASKSQPIPQELLDLDNQRCMKDCVPGFGEETCKPLCDCTVKEFQKRLDFSQYLDMSVQLSRNELKPETRSLLDSVATYCTAEIDKAGIEVGQPQEGGSR
ncbi:MAG: hypothetical protein EP335_05315 [Alphaproteobacteria bacterium]|nr:MAG: hypothetical protein EP335_05315 [Alphaproteobacteria bacterium]